MARPQRIVATGTGAGVTYSAIYPTNWRAGESAIGIGLSISGTTTTAKVQHTFADPALDTDTSTWVWFDHPDTAAGGLGAAEENKRTGSYTFPVTAIRFELGATGTATWTMHIVPSTS